jgi:hypothetical protein
MNCKTIQHYLLGVENPARPPADVQAHLADCAACSDWQRRLLRIERNAPVVPVPPSRTKAAFLRKFLAQPAARKTPPAQPRPKQRAHSPRIVERWPLAAAGLAAAVLVVAGWWVLTARNSPQVVVHPCKPAPDPLLANLLQHDLRLARAESPRERVQALADLADELHGETRTQARAAASDNLQTLAVLYGRVVRQGILTQAAALPADERDDVLPSIADRLGRTEKEAEQLAQQAPAGVADPLKQIARAAREGQASLRGVKS